MLSHKYTFLIFCASYSISILSGTINIKNKTPFSVYVENVEWQGCSDDDDITIAPGATFTEKWRGSQAFGTAKCTLKKIRAQINDSNRYYYQNLYNYPIVEGTITCYINTSLSDTQPDVISCFKTSDEDISRKQNNMNVFIHPDRNK